VPIIGLIINKSYGKKFELSTEQIEEMTGVPVLASIPHDIDIPKALSELKPSTFETKNSDAVVEYKKLAAFLVGKSYKDQRFKTKLKTFFSNSLYIDIFAFSFSFILLIKLINISNFSNPISSSIFSQISV